MKKFFAIVALTLGLSGAFAAGTASPASAHHADCQLVSVWLTINPIGFPATHVVCI